MIRAWRPCATAYVDASYVLHGDRGDVETREPSEKISCFRGLSSEQHIHEGTSVDEMVDPQSFLLWRFLTFHQADEN